MLERKWKQRHLCTFCNDKMVKVTRKHGPVETTSAEVSEVRKIVKLPVQ